MPTDFISVPIAETRRITVFRIVESILPLHIPSTFIAIPCGNRAQPIHCDIIISSIPRRRLRPSGLGSGAIGELISRFITGRIPECIIEIAGSPASSSHSTSAGNVARAGSATNKQLVAAIAIEKNVKTLACTRRKRKIPIPLEPSIFTSRTSVGQLDELPFLTECRLFEGVDASQVLVHPSKIFRISDCSVLNEMNWVRISQEDQNPCRNRRLSEELGN